MNEDEFIVGLYALDTKTASQQEEFLKYWSNYLINDLSLTIPLEKQIPDLIVDHCFKKLISLIPLAYQTHLQTIIPIIDRHIVHLSHQPTQVQSYGKITNPSMELAAKLVNTLLAPLSLILQRKESQEIKKHINAYKQYLDQKMRSQMASPYQELLTFTIRDRETQLLVERYCLIHELQKEIQNQDVLSGPEKANITHGINQCLKLHSSSSERFFSHRLTELLDTKIYPNSSVPLIH